MTKYSIGPLHFECSWRFEWRTRRHDRIHAAADAYCRLNPLRVLRRHEQSPVTWCSPIVETELFYCGSINLKSRRELLAVIHELRRRGYGPCLHEELIAPNELWEFFALVRNYGITTCATVKNGLRVEVEVRSLDCAEDLYFEVYRWRNEGRWP